MALKKVLLMHTYTALGNVVPGLLATFAGIACIALSRRMSRGAVRFNELLLKHRFKEAYYRAGYLAAGAGFVALGLLALLGIVDFRH